MPIFGIREAEGAQIHIRDVKQNYIREVGVETEFHKGGGRQDKLSHERWEARQNYRREVASIPLVTPCIPKHSKVETFICFRVSDSILISSL